MFYTKKKSFHWIKFFQGQQDQHFHFLEHQIFCKDYEYCYALNMSKVFPR